MKKSKNVTFANYPNKAAWLASRKDSIGASEVAIVLGISHFKSITDFWEEKTGRKEAPDLSNNKAVAYGTDAEEHIRKLFALKNKGVYEVSYHRYRVYKNKQFPYLSATLDGELKRLSDGELGVWECKTTLIQSKAALDSWNGKIPDYYYCQVLQQLAITERSFAVLTAELSFPDGNSEIRNYLIEVNGKQDEMDYIIAEAGKFWNNNVLGNKRPKISMML